VELLCRRCKSADCLVSRVVEEPLIKAHLSGKAIKHPDEYAFTQKPDRRGHVFLRIVIAWQARLYIRLSVIVGHTCRNLEDEIADPAVI